MYASGECVGTWDVRKRMHCIVTLKEEENALYCDSYDLTRWLDYQRHIDRPPPQAPSFTGPFRKPLFEKVLQERPPGAYLYIYIYIYTVYLYIHIYVCVCAWGFVGLEGGIESLHPHICMCMCTYMLMHIYICMYMYMYMYMYIYMYMCLYIYMYMYRYMHMHMHACIYIRICVYMYMYVLWVRTRCKSQRGSRNTLSAATRQVGHSKEPEHTMRPSS